MEPTTLLPVIAVLSLISVEYGGWALLGFLTGCERLGGFRERFFRAGHVTPGFCWYSRSSTSCTSTGVQWLAGLLLLAGILVQSGGFFIHLGLGQPNQSSLGTIVTRSGAVLIAAALLILVAGLLTSG